MIKVVFNYYLVSSVVRLENYQWTKKCNNLLKSVKLNFARETEPYNTKHKDACRCYPDMTLEDFKC